MLGQLSLFLHSLFAQNKTKLLFVELSEMFRFSSCLVQCHSIFLKKVQWMSEAFTYHSRSLCFFTYRALYHLRFSKPICSSELPTNLLTNHTWYHTHSKLRFNVEIDLHLLLRSSTWREHFAPLLFYLFLCQLHCSQLSSPSPLSLSQREFCREFSKPHSCWRHPTSLHFLIHCPQSLIPDLSLST